MRGEWRGEWRGDGVGLIEWRCIGSGDRSNDGSVLLCRGEG